MILFAALLLCAVVPQDKPVDFESEILPIFMESCSVCHGAEKEKARLRLDIKAGGLYTNDLLVAGKPLESYLFERINLPGDDLDVMPPEDGPLPPDQVELIRRWIEEGADWPDSVAGSAGTEPSSPPWTIPAATGEALALETAAIAALAEQRIQVLRVSTRDAATEVNFALRRAEVGDEQAKHLAGLAPTLVRADFSRTAITDKALESVAHCKELRWLNLSNTKVTDAGVAHLAGLRHLEYLNLYGTTIGDAGLAKVGALSNLKSLYLWQTQVTDAMVAELQALRPKLKIVRGMELPSDKQAKAPINTMCPVMDAEVDAEITSEFEEQLVAFCCVKCKAAFDADPESFREKLGLEHQAAGPINTECPVSDAPIDAEVTSEFAGKQVGFCCVKCKAAFDADPESFRAKLGL